MKTMTTYTNVKPSRTDLLTAISGVTDGKADAAERGWVESIQERQAEMEAQWHQLKCTWSWVDLQPKYLSHIEWYGYEDRQTGEIDEPGFLREPKVPCRVLF